jgi:hypothetical protein
LEVSARENLPSKNATYFPTSRDAFGPQEGRAGGGWVGPNRIKGEPPRAGLRTNICLRRSFRMFLVALALLDSYTDVAPMWLCSQELSEWGGAQCGLYGTEQWLLHTDATLALPWNLNTYLGWPVAEAPVARQVSSGWVTHECYRSSAQMHC